MIRPSLLLPCLLTLTVVGAPAIAAGGDWYVGAGGGVSRLTPDTDGSGFELEGETSAAVGVFGGRAFGRRYAFELGATRLGEAELSGDEAIDYSVLSGGVLGYVVGDALRVRRGEAAGGFLRLGLGAIDNASDVPLEREDNVSVWVGIGADVPIGRAWGLRAELASFDGDAQAATVALVWRPRGGGPAVTVPRAATASEPTAPSTPAAEDAPETSVASAPTPTERSVVASAPAAEDAPETSATARPTVPAPTRDDVSPPRPAATPAGADCPPPSGDEPVDGRGCARFGGVLDGVEFAPGTATLTDGGARALEDLASALLAEPGITIEIRSHVASEGDAAAAMALSRERAVATARHLAGQGVPVARLRARAFGDEMPRAGGEPDARIEIDVVAP